MIQRIANPPSAIERVRKSRRQNPMVLEIPLVDSAETAVKLSIATKVKQP